MARAAAKKKGASRNTRSSAGRQGVPGWLWLALGLAIGVFTAFLWHLWELRHAAPAKAGSRIESAAASAESGDSPPAPAKEDEPRFEFYTLLPGQEVFPGKSRPAPAGQQPAARHAQYLLQAGSFRNEAEADKRRASLLMLGMPVKIAKVPGKAGEIWYRVVVGPFAGKAAAQAARDSLRSSGVDTLVIKQG